jgi:hypothetical protein
MPPFLPVLLIASEHEMKKATRYINYISKLFSTVKQKPMMKSLILFLPILLLIEQRVVVAGQCESSGGRC